MPACNVIFVCPNLYFEFVAVHIFGFHFHEFVPIVRNIVAAFCFYNNENNLLFVS